MMSWTGLDKFVDVIFGITQKQLYITSSNLFRKYVTNKGIFSEIVSYPGDGLVTIFRHLLFLIILSIKRNQAWKKK